MTKQVTVEELATNLRDHIAEVNSGQTLVVVDGTETVARLAPPELSVIAHDPSLRLQDFRPSPRPKRLDFDAVQWLIDERDRERSGKKYGL